MQEKLSPMWQQCIEISAVLNCLYSTIHWLLSAHWVCVLWNSSYHMSCHVIHTMSCEPRSKSCHVIHTISPIMSNDHMSHDHIIFDHVTWLGKWCEQLKINVPNVFNYTCSKKFKLVIVCLYVCIDMCRQKWKQKYSIHLRIVSFPVSSLCGCDNPMVLTY